ncbi:hypothetical protein N802_01800 [Knoellia sinensis KCTC 19936]|uniref:Uncharacterized protein n=1 Tax=Knoellia sinensis KCTC 19936 TaxID=1385520 RepID=A0A0A0JGQ8_9MICO|nr:hypothetical protein [Knoellia sinensis]KGN34811.1 hypothetical protein N802_01800 [Knoellia sinensis KCTC 19936]
MSPATPALFEGLIDDAAVFPPGNAPLEVAIERHHGHRKTSYAGLIGPLLVPASDVDRLVTEASKTPQQSLTVGLIARPGVDPSVVVSAVERLRGEETVSVAGAELGWFAGWRNLPVDGLPLTLEVPRGTDRDRALEDIRAGADEVGHQVQAKFRTGATPTWAWPDETELATFIHDCARLGVPFKLTGGLHHAIRAEHDGDPQHGLLNVLLAVHSAAHDGALVAVESVLGQRDPDVLAEAVQGLEETDARRLRSLLTAYGCCEVTDPIGELDDLDLLDLEG